MNKICLIKYIERQCTPEEKQLVEQWIESDIKNKRYFIQLKDTYIFSNFSDEQASQAQMEIAAKITRNSEHTGKKRIVVNKKILLSIYSIAAVIIIALITNISLIIFDKDVVNEGDSYVSYRELLDEIPTGFKHEIYTNKGVKGAIELPDGSKVKLNSDSKIIFPEKFTGSTREVFLTGEAYFDVIKNPNNPMIISTSKNITVKVLGTKLNVRSYENEANAKTTLISGQIDIISKSKAGKDIILAEMKPNESFEFRGNKQVKIINDNTVKVIAWTKGNLVFDKTPLEQVLRELERWHGANFIVKDSSVYNLKLSATFKQESLIQILEILKFCTGVKFDLHENTATLWLNNKNNS